MVLIDLKKRVGYFILVGLFSIGLGADPFEECPSKAYLFQGNNVQIYELNLVTGSYSLMEDYVGLDGNVNGVGFNFIDRYIYGFNTSSYKVIRIDKLFQATELNVTGLPENTTFFVGDVANNFYYIYRENVGFYRINLDQAREKYLVAEKMEDANISLQLNDFAAHPGNDDLYAVDNNTGILHQISVTTGVSIEVGDTGETGTFGAGYFDVNGYYYISRNSDGNIFRIDLTEPEQPNVTAVLFAQGPFSSENDGARCAYAPISVENTDWGDAPTSYGTLFSDNGPRHEITTNIYLGTSAPDGESDGLPFAVNDDNSNEDDEDGIGFVTPIEIGLDGLIQVTVEGNGFLHGWIDWNSDGDFNDESENLFSSVELLEGIHTLNYRVPECAIEGNSWARFRYSTTEVLTALGGAPDGEVEDYPVSITLPDVSYRYYPSETGWVALAFEDVWPSTGDYDLNDVVMHYRIVELERDDKVIRVDLYGSLQALGAVYHNGFAVHIPTVDRANVDQTRLRTLFNNDLQDFNPLEDGQSEVVIKVSDDLRLNIESDCRFYRTEADCNEEVEFSFEVSVNFLSPIELEVMPSAPYNPFIFGTPYWGRDEVFAVSPGRSLEIHLPDMPNTDLADVNLFGLNDDTSEIANQRYYKTSGNLPWAIEVGVEWLYPLERVDVMDAYPQFKDWVESGGETNKNWYLPENAIIQNVY